jgi:PAS domain S-box-containing protein
MIDALKSLEKESAEYDCRLQTVLDSLPLIAWTVAANGIPLYYNSKWFQYTGLSKSEPVDLIQVIHPDDFQSAMEKRMAAYASGEVYEAEFRLRRYDGVYRWHRTLSEPVRDSAGRVIRYLKTTTDIDAERELERLNAELDRRVLDRTTDLAQANAELEAFTYHVAHDLRAPLRAIASKCRILEEDFREFLPEDAVGLIDRQVQAANKLGTLIDELLKLSRLSREQAIHQVVDLSTLACDVAAELAHENDDAIVVVQESMSTVADPRLIRLLLGNLISNALQYSPKGGQIHVGCEPTENGLAFFVRDQGTGFDMQFADQIFRPFERLVSDTEFPGTGVGLANVARIVSKHQGKVWAVSELGKGSTFYFTLG